ncbi:MAG: hypothetical protein AB4038_02155 [Prochloraceae cyanobacterium]
MQDLFEIAFSLSNSNCDRATIVAEKWRFKTYTVEQNASKNHTVKS